MGSIGSPNKQTRSISQPKRRPVNPMLLKPIMENVATQKQAHDKKDQIF